MSATESPTLFCRRCGTPIASGVSFCGRCGLQVAQVPAASPAPPPPPPPPPPPTANRPPAGAPAGYGAPGAYGAPGGNAAPPGYTPPPGYAPPPAANPYAAPGAGGYQGAAPGGYAQAPTGYAQAPTGYAQAPTGYAQQPTGYAQAPTGWGQPAAPPSPAMARSATARRGRVPSIVKFAVLAIVLVVVGSVIVKAVQGKSLSTSARCVYTCGPDIGAVQPLANAFHTSDGFSFSYPGGWKQASTVHGFIADFTSSSTGGQFLVAGGSGSPSLSSGLSAAEQRVAPAFQDFTAVGSLPGARLGDQPGAGSIYSGEDATSSGQELPVRIIFITAEQGGHWATLTGVSGLNTNILPTGVNDGGSFDDVLTQWVWSS